MAPTVIRIGSLEVFLLGRKVGTIEYSSHNNEMRFAYDDEYLADNNAVPLSFALPLAEGSFDRGKTTTFFENLLPPDEVRRKLGSILHLSRHNIFGFLKALGADCAGAISLWERGSYPHDGEEKLLPLDDERADEVMKSLKKRPLYVNGVDGYRISGSGAQNKLIARIVDDKISLPLFGTPSTHIIKPAVADYPDSVYNEFFSMQLARELGLNVADCGLMRIKEAVYYWTKRFDRKVSGGRVQRLHQEDFCQILGISAELKYESEGGPSFKSCMSAIREMRLGLVHQLAFIDRMAFNYLVGNADGHGKNSSILYKEDKAVLAPIYDVMSTAVYSNLSRVNAMSIGGANGFADVNRESFSRMAAEVEMNPSIVLGRLDSLSARIGPAAKKLMEKISAKWPSAVYSRIIDVIDSHVAQLTQ